VFVAKQIAAIFALLPLFYEYGIYLPTLGHRIDGFVYASLHLSVLYVFLYRSIESIRDQLA